MHKDIFQSPEYVRSRKAYMAQCVFEYLVSITVADAFLARLLTSIGISDAMIGIISSLISFSFLFQLLTLLLMSHLKNTKKTVIIFDTVSQLFFMSIFLVPLFPFGVEVKTGIVIICILVAYLLKYLISTICFKWANSYVSPWKRGEYSAVKEMVSLVSGIIFTLLAGYLLDYFDNKGKLEAGFFLIAAIMLVINICNFICLVLIKNEAVLRNEKNRQSVKMVLQNTLGNRKFVNVVIMSCLWQSAQYMTYGFLGTFKTTDLLLGVGAVQVINMIGNVGRLFLSRAFGRYSDRTSYAKGFRMALVLMALAVFVNIFTTRQNWWFVVIFTVLYSIGMAGINQNSFNISYNYVSRDYVVQAMAIKNSISGVVGFLASLTGGGILAYIQKNGNSLFGITMYGQQFLSAISTVIIIITIVFIKKVIEKQERIIQ